MAKNISLLGANYPNVPAVQLPQTGGGTATFVDPSEIKLEVVSSQEVTYAENVEATSNADKLICEKYNNGMIRLRGTFHITTSATGTSLTSPITIPSGYGYSSVKNSGMQAWVPVWSSNGKIRNCLLSGNTLTKWGDSFEAGYWQIDYWYCS